MMDKIYQPHELEKKWYQTWDQAGYFSLNTNTTKEAAYCIMLPPPNVTGSLHMGHAFQDTLMDALIRYHRMLGFKTLWQGGTDHAGIATQMVVERQLQADGISKHDLGREKFVEKIWDWKEQSGSQIMQQMRRLGASVDWSRECFTMDEARSEAVKEVFVRLYDEGLIYRGKRLVNWDPKLHTALSDLEVIAEEEDGFLWYIRYPIANQPEKHIVVATTRPETMFGDVAVAVHPDDERYRSLVGEKLQLPLTERLIDIIADDSILPEFGTGCVKITPAHDFNDHEIGKRHGLAMINILDDNAVLNKNVPTAYQDLERFVARKKIIDDLEKLNLIEKIEPYKIKIPRGDRSGEIVEPYLTDQWFMNVKPLAEKAIEVVQNGKIKFVPDNWKNTYFEWMNNIQDWCISRQLWWGHRIPAWYDEQGNLYVGYSEEQVKTKYGLGDNHVLKQDNDVLDTWFSSALWPFSTLGWPHKTEELKTFYPTNVLVTGFDIIFFWVARMVMMGLKFTDQVPFHTVFVHGLIQDAQGQKMSKSKGNIIDPIDLIDGIGFEALVKKRTSGLMQPQMKAQIEKNTKKEFPEGIPSFGTDALRMTFCSIATTGRHIRFDLNRVEAHRNFCNKLWNAARYVLMSMEGKSLGNSETERNYSIYDRWIQSSWQKTKQMVAQHFEAYRFDLLVQCLYDFTWNQYCDWYLEFTKPVLMESDNEHLKQGIRHTLITILDEMLRVFHPIIPFITEEIWQKTNALLNPNAENPSIMMQSYPQLDPNQINEEAEKAVDWVKNFIINIRTIRSEMNVNPSQKLPVIMQGGNSFDIESAHSYEMVLKSLAKVSELRQIANNEQLPISATSLVGEMTLHIPLKDLIDKEKEMERLNKEMVKLSKDIDMFSKKLNNDSYVQNAPKDIVEKDRERLSSAEVNLEKLKINFEKIAAL